jgi:hypothetical protein
MSISVLLQFNATFFSGVKLGAVTHDAISIMDGLRLRLREGIACESQPEEEHRDQVLHSCISCAFGFDAKTSLCRQNNTHRDNRFCYAVIAHKSRFMK